MKRVRVHTGDHVADLCIQAVLERWGSGWTLLSKEMQAAALAQEVLRTVLYVWAEWPATADRTHREAAIQVERAVRRWHQPED